uniref:Transcriptional regulator n=1 Tax=uncultured marine thaumarchaeote KM3_95_D02 TaxID=1456347 RepID=A0A075HYX7_9ARCH|nr:transcriptional regulator [uncultured marine thaumarchaeote KM3_95_D02]
MPLPKLEDIRDRRNILKITQDELAGKADVTRAMISKIENGHHSISYRKAAKIFDYLETRELYDMKKQKTAGEICVTDLVKVALYDTIAEVKKKMKPKGLSQLLVYSHGKYVGLITVKIMANNKNLKKSR